MNNNISEGVRTYQMCSNCVMDTTDIDIVFDDRGVCNYCRDYIAKQKRKVEKSSEVKRAELDKIVREIKEYGKGKPYDCLMGLSGGVDSSYVTYLLKELGLRTLVVHMDNGWNSELSVMNVEKILRYTGFDLYTNVLNWKEFRDMQVAYLKAGVLDLEALSDHAINATVYDAATKYDIKYVMNGSNPATESILPTSWRYLYKLTDATNIKSIVKKEGHFSPKYFPLMSFSRHYYNLFFKNFKTVSLLEYVDFDKKDAIKTIQQKMGWRDYGGKHYESVITRFYQGYILPQKFGIDKRKAHLASMILSGQVTRATALDQLSQPIMDAKVLRNDLEFVPKKLKLSKQEFEDIMNGPVRSHFDYPSDLWLKKLIAALKFWRK